MLQSKTEKEKIRISCMSRQKKVNCKVRKKDHI